MYVSSRFVRFCSFNLFFLDGETDSEEDKPARKRARTAQESEDDYEREEEHKLVCPHSPLSLFLFDLF